MGVKMCPIGTRPAPAPGGAPPPPASWARDASGAAPRPPRPPPARRSISTRFTASRCSHEENALSPRNDASLRHACTNTSCVRSSASAALPVSLRQSAYIRPTCARYSSWNADWSPCWARRTTSVTRGPGEGTLLGCPREAQGLGHRGPLGVPVRARLVQPCEPHQLQLVEGPRDEAQPRR